MPSLTSPLPPPNTPITGAGGTPSLAHAQYAASLDAAVRNPATTLSLGPVQPDGTTITITPAGVISAGAVGGSLVSVKVYSSSNSSLPVLGTNALVLLWGASGGSGGSGTSASGGVGAPGFLLKFLSGLSTSNTLNYSQGTAGAAGTSSGAGGNGTATTLSGTGFSTLTANGSNGSIAGGATKVAGTAGGTASGGDLNKTGQSGGYGLNDSYDNWVVPGIGGVTDFAPAAPNGVAYTSSAQAGTAGSAGGMIIYWFT